MVNKIAATIILFLTLFLFFEDGMISRVTLGLVYVFSSRDIKNETDNS